MSCTRPNTIETIDCEQPMIYDPIRQIVEVDMRTVGTKSLKTSATWSTARGCTHNKTCKQDRKNEIDDSKSVK